MPDFELFIGNKNYSSWSFRPWIGLKQKGIAFRETLVPFDFDNGNPAFKAFSPTMKVPVLKDGALTVWESMAILEYAAEVYPDAGLWPEHREQRATARAMSGEMHSGFAALRSACPMNMRRNAKPIAVTAAMSEDIERIVSLWSECLDRSGGPFLFGDFTIADAMYAPVVSRFGSYGLTQDAVAGRYCATMRALPVWQDWETVARIEPWTITSEEI